MAASEQTPAPRVDTASPWLLFSGRTLPDHTSLSTSRLTASRVACGARCAAKALDPAALSRCTEGGGDGDQDGCARPEGGSGSQDVGDQDGDTRKKRRISTDEVDIVYR